MESEKVLWEMSAGAGDAAACVAPGRFEKELLRVGRWAHPAGKFVLEVTRERLKRWAENFARMLAKGIRVPVPYGHSYDARDNAGFLTDMRLEGDRLVGVLEIPREEDRARLGSTATDVSVSVNPDFVDGAGERLGEVIEHVAITNYPIVSGQENFVPLAVEGAGVIRLEMEKPAAESPESGGQQELPPETQPQPAAEEDSSETDAADTSVLLERIAQLELSRVDREIEGYLLSGRISPAVEGNVRRILLAHDGRVELSATGEGVSPAGELRAILAAMPAGAWVPVEARASAARALARRELEVSDERAKKLAAENAALLTKGGEGRQAN
jgi:hypothetical protein